MIPSFETGSPRTGAELSHAMLTLLREGTAWLQGFDAEAFFAPQGAAWSPADHLRHLRKTTVPVTFGLRVPRMLLGLFFGRRTAPSRSYEQIRDGYRGSLTLNSSAGSFAPRPEPRPADPARRRAEIMQTWEGAVLGFTVALQRWPEPALDRFLLPHPRLGRLSAREMAAFTVYHTAHHLARIAERADRSAIRPAAAEAR
jgi:hypothetical protein